MIQLYRLSVLPSDSKQKSNLHTVKKCSKKKQKINLYENKDDNEVSLVLVKLKKTHTWH